MDIVDIICYTEINYPANEIKTNKKKLCERVQIQEKQIIFLKMDVEKGFYYCTHQNQECNNLIGSPEFWKGHQADDKWKENWKGRKVTK